MQSYFLKYFKNKVTFEAFPLKTIDRKTAING
jgi:hypothetical protein